MTREFILRSTLRLDAPRPRVWRSRLAWLVWRVFVTDYIVYRARLTGRLCVHRERGYANWVRRQPYNPTLSLSVGEYIDDMVVSRAVRDIKRSEDAHIAAEFIQALREEQQ